MYFGWECAGDGRCLLPNLFFKTFPQFFTMLHSLQMKKATFPIARREILYQSSSGIKPSAVARRKASKSRWRRAASLRTDLRMIHPYWEGPDMAAVIEHGMRLKLRLATGGICGHCRCYPNQGSL